MNAQAAVRREPADGLPIGGSRCAIRVVQNGSDFVMVYEPESRGTTPQLVFEDNSGIKRLSRFPTTWRRLSDAELLRLRPD